MVLLLGTDAAQTLFGARLQDEHSGIAPLQRVADRLAVKAVPLGDVVSAGPLRHEESYRGALRVALRDRLVTSNERIQLFRLAEDLGIPAGRAAEIQDEVGREAAVRG